MSRALSVAHGAFADHKVYLNEVVAVNIPVSKWTRGRVREQMVNDEARQR